MYNLTPVQNKVYDFLSSYYKENGYSPTMKEVATYLGVSVSTVQGHFNELEKKRFIEKDPQKSRSIKIKDFENEKVEKLPVSGAISAGAGITVIEENEEHIDVPKSWLNGIKNDFFVLKVSGFSMFEDGILDGDYVVVRKQAYADDGDIVVGIIHENFEEKATLKKLKNSRSNIITLKPSNPNLEDIKIPREKFQIRGKFVGLIRQ